MLNRPQFIFVTCQVGAEEAVKNEIDRLWPAFHFAYSRPGFLTFKLPQGHLLPDDFNLHSVFARAYGFSLGKSKGDDIETLARGVWEVWGDRPVERIHAWQRDAAPPGEHYFEPSITPTAVEAAQAIRRASPNPAALPEGSDDLKVPAPQGSMVLDCVLVQPNEWWLGCHKVHSFESQWPGGLLPLELPPDVVSRAWLKMEEALRWSRLPSRPGTRWVEIGSAPGGAIQALLARGMKVLGVDPAEMEPTVLAHPNFTHIRRRASQVRRREFAQVRFLTADMNVAPNYTLDVVEDIVMHPAVNIQGLLLTLKLFEWKLADELPEYLERIRSWGYSDLRARQLQHNRQEVTVAALRTAAGNVGPEDPESRRGGKARGS